MASTIGKQDELQIKHVALQQWRYERKISRKEIIASEFVLGRNSCRADIAFYDGSGLAGVEIKSARDSLARLDAQLETYQNCFEQVSLIASERHFPNVREKVPNTVNLYKVGADSSLSLVSAASTHSTPDRTASLRLLSNRELRLALRLPANEFTLQRSELIDQSESLSYEEVRKAVFESFSKKFSSTSEEFWRVVGRRKIRAQHLRYLSPYRTKHEKLKKLKAKRASESTEWLKEARLVFGELKSG